MSGAFPNGVIHLDEMTKRFRLVNPDEHHLARNIIELSEEIQGDADDFIRRVADISDLMDRMSSFVQSAKMELIGRRCHLFMAANHRRVKRKFLEAEIFEKAAQLERNHLYIDSLHRQLQDQTELLNRISRK